MSPTAPERPVAAAAGAAETDARTTELLAPVLDHIRALDVLSHAALVRAPWCAPLVAAAPAVRAEATVRLWQERASGRVFVGSHLFWAVVGALDQRDLRYTLPQLVRISRAIADSDHWEAPAVGAVVRGLQDHACEGRVPEALVGPVSHLRAVLAQSWPKMPAIRAMDELLGTARDWSPDDAWGRLADLVVAEQEKPATWRALLAHAAAAGTGSKPKKTWLRATPALVAAAPGFSAALDRMCAAAIMGPTFEVTGEWETPDPDNMRHQNRLTLRGLVWAASTAVDAEATGRTVASLAERCFRKIPGFGAGAQKLGNACLWTLGELPDGVGVPWLSRLAGRVRYMRARALVEKALDAAATRAGVSREEVEELALPTLGLDDQAQREVSLGEHRAVIAIGPQGNATLTVWKGDHAFKTVPKAVRTEHAAELRTLKAQLKELKALLAGQSHRIERLFTQDRDWSLVDWAERYGSHPLVIQLVRRLIWTVDGIPVLPTAAGFVRSDGTDWTPPAQARVRLWHPLTAPTEEVSALRDLLAARGITQPFRQAHRAIYRLTPAERTAGTTSARFAGHLLRQHQFAELCRQRAWTYRIQGPWDSHNTPERTLSGWTVRLAVEGVEDGTPAYSGFGLLSTGELAFTQQGMLSPLPAVPALLFSELMRDVDLFVGVCSVGTDPTWADRAHARPEDWARWQDWAFGELRPQAAARRETLGALLPMLAMGDKLALEGNYLAVQGDERRYRIHLGSGNILMDPGGYLCIVPAPTKRGPGVALPFEGDLLLSIILSKALMLVNDHKIKDLSIRRQLDGPR